MVFIEAWNEFGEGDYIEPHREFGFAYLDAIRAVFTSAAPSHVDITPMDVGLGPYELEKPPTVTSWSFDNDDNPPWDCT
ncbi:MAG: glycoside hydrolase family 99-like domain-containing protein, partial [Armatimonadetes bacterium]|nr:glycoside hydrolase family 99-like domain-containing protein [Armatimonadota bacterium]